MTKFGVIAVVFCLVVSFLASRAAWAEPNQSFAGFITDFEGRAAQAGISRETYHETMFGLKPVSNIAGLVSRQPEFTTPMWEYIEGRVSPGRIGRGRKSMAANEALFDRIGDTYGVDPAILGAIWGMETDYGSILNNQRFIKPIIPALATLVHQRRGRLAADEDALLAALLLVERGPWQANSLVGSWAGAIGHTQIIVSAFALHGTDGDRDGRIDPHISLADALASTAVYLRALGYVPGVDWGFEVSLPEGFDYRLVTRTQMRSVREFVSRGVVRVKGRQFADLDEPVFLYVPTGQHGPKFLMTRNYLVLKGYNFSDSYALSVAHLTDRLKGGGAFVTGWPKSTKFPNLSQRVDIQKWLSQLGFYQGDVDGRIGPISQEAYQKFQVEQGILADGFITLESYDALRAATQ